ncbi:MAG: hypothetical protein AB7G21_06155 [Dehalococcoidia bacterium]
MTEPANEPPAPEPTLFGQNRAEWEQHLAKLHGAAWVESQRGFLDTEWRHLLERFGDQRDPDAPLTPDPNPNFRDE